uniref:Novel immune-type receptor 12 n=1 Tax=Salmo trutta TaxID=8032 RepID=A0A673VWF7_SALTR
MVSTGPGFGRTLPEINNKSITIYLRCPIREDLVEPAPLTKKLNDSFGSMPSGVGPVTFESGTNAIAERDQVPGEQAPVLMLSLYFHSNTATFFGEFINSTRFTETKSGTRFVLTISDARPSDMGMYYCAARDYDAMIFRKGVFLMHGDSKNHDLTQQSVSESVQPGDSVTPNCTIHTEACVGKHSIYWFRHGSGESRPGIIYTYGDWSDQCEKSPEAGSPTQSCVYNLPKRNLSLSDAGTCYCAVASCGGILFGNGTKLDIDRKKWQGRTYSVEDDDTLTSVHYAALNVIHKKPKTRRQRSTMETDTVFSGVRCQNMD